MGYITPISFCRSASWMEFVRSHVVGHVPRLIRVIVPRRVGLSW